MQAALDALTAGAAGDANLLALVDRSDASARVTVGEISDALEKVFGRYRAHIRTISGVYGGAYADDEEFRRIRADADTFAAETGRRPRILVAKLGQDGHDRGAKVIATTFADLGFDVDIGSLFQTPAEAARDAIENDVHVVGVSSQAAGHTTLVPQLIDELRDQGASDIVVVVGGVIPAADYDLLASAGVAAVFGPGSNICRAASQVLALVRERRAPTPERGDRMGAVELTFLGAGDAFGSGGRLQTCMHLSGGPAEHAHRLRYDVARRHETSGDRPGKHRSHRRVAPPR